MNYFCNCPADHWKGSKNMQDYARRCVGAIRKHLQDPESFQGCVLLAELEQLYNEFLPEDRE